LNAHVSPVASSRIFERCFSLCNFLAYPNSCWLFSGRVLVISRESCKVPTIIYTANLYLYTQPKQTLIFLFDTFKTPLHPPFLQLYPASFLTPKSPILCPINKPSHHRNPGPASSPSSLSPIPLRISLQPRAPQLRLLPYSPPLPPMIVATQYGTTCRAETCGTMITPNRNHPILAGANVGEDSEDIDIATTP